MSGWAGGGIPQPWRPWQLLTMPVLAPPEAPQPSLTSGPRRSAGHPRCADCKDAPSSACAYHAHYHHAYDVRRSVG